MYTHTLVSQKPNEVNEVLLFLRTWQIQLDKGTQLEDIQSYLVRAYSEAMSTAIILPRPH